MVASPKQMGSTPVASGSSTPVCPAFSARYKRRACCKAVLLDRLSGLSSKRTPLTGRLLGLFAVILRWIRINWQPENGFQAAFAV